MSGIVRARSSSTVQLDLLRARCSCCYCFWVPIITTYCLASTRATSSWHFNCVQVFFNAVPRTNTPAVQFHLCTCIYTPCTFSWLLHPNNPAHNVIINDRDFSHKLSTTFLNGYKHYWEEKGYILIITFPADNVTFKQRDSFQCQRYRVVMNRCVPFSNGLCNALSISVWK